MALVARTLGLALVQGDVSGELEASLGNGGGRGGQGEDRQSQLHLERLNKRVEVCEKTRLRWMMVGSNSPPHLHGDDYLYLTQRTTQPPVENRLWDFP